MRPTPLAAAPTRWTGRTLTLALTAALCVLAAPLARAADEAAAADAAPAPSNEQVIVPKVDRRDVRVPKIPSNDFEIGAYGGTYSTQNFGAHKVSGARLGYHVTEDVFFEGVYGQTTVSDQIYRQVLPSGIFATPEEKLTYYNLSAGLNILPGEIFLGRSIARASAVYLIAGVGSTKFATKLDSQRRQTINYGVGVRLFMADWAALQVDMRNHLFSIDILGKRQSTQNLELTGGLTLFF